MIRKKPNIRRLSPRATLAELVAGFNEISDFLNQIAAEQGGVAASTMNKSAIPWSKVEKVGSSLSDLEDTSHTLLATVAQADDTQMDNVGGKHVTNALVHKYETHRLAPMRQTRHYVYDIQGTGRKFIPSGVQIVIDGDGNEIPQLILTEV